MQIYLDNKALDFQLEKEKNLYEIVAALDKWLSSENFYITQLIADDKVTDFRDADLLKSLQIESINELKISTATMLELKLSQLNAIQEYFLIIMKNIEAGNTENLIKVLDDYRNIKPLLKNCIDKVYSNNTGFIENFLNNKSEIEKNLKGIMIFSENIMIIAETRKNEIISPEKELELLKQQFADAAEDAGNVSILLQTGKDKEAMDKVIEFVEFMKKLSRIISILDMKKMSPADKDNIQQFNTMLSELCSAIENADSVLLGDLLEYEIVPVVESLLAGI